MSLNEDLIRELRERYPHVGLASERAAAPDLSPADVRAFVDRVCDLVDKAQAHERDAARTRGGNAWLEHVHRTGGQGHSRHDGPAYD